MASSIEQFQNRRFGIFIHWGVYSMLGGRWKGKTTPYIGEWAQSYFHIPNTEYELEAKKLNPAGFNADDWIRRIADAGAKYIVYTSKHHDGFAMYHSKSDPYNIVDWSGFRCDPLKELADACKKYGIGLGIYYSQNLDWHEKNARDMGPDINENAYCMPWGNTWDFKDFASKDFSKFFYGKCRNQIRELLTEYGPVCELWCDCAGGMSREDSANLRDFVHSLQPDCVINSRIGNDLGDFKSLGDNQNMQGRSAVPVESPITLNDTWGFKFDDNNWKTSAHIAERLASLASRNANLLLNVGPDGNGVFPDATNKILDDLAAWHKKYPNVISGTTYNPFPQESEQFYCTQSGNTLNLFLKGRQEKIVLYGVSGTVVKAGCHWESAKDRLILFPQEKDENDLLQVISVTFADRPVFEKKLSLSEDGLSLIPCSGEVSVGKDKVDESGEIRLNVAAEIEKITGHLRIRDDGSASDWQNPNDLISWPLRVLDPGKYKVSIISCQSEHSAPWVGKRVVEIGWGKQKIQAELKNPAPVVSYCYEAGEATVGTIDFSNAENGSLTCRTVSIEHDPLAASMNLLRVRLTKC